MSKITITPISGYPEWTPGVRMQEQRLIDVIKRQYELFGFTSIETPAVERLEVLTAKGGMHRQIFTLGRLTEDEGGETLGMHFDLTVPLARYVAQRSNDLVFPFRRYQIQKVWRGERAQRGRFREFYQCDIDIIGRKTLSVIQDAEIVAVIDSTLSAIREITDGALPNHKIHLNHRKILSALFAALKIDEAKSADVLREIDKMSRDGKDATKDRLKELGVSQSAVETIMALTSSKELDEARQLLASIKADDEGINEMSQVLENALQLGVPRSNIVLGFGIARGLDYYTGTVFETLIDGKEKWGSICSGGRYDDLASYFTTQKFPGVGVSIGLSRLFDLMVQSKIITIDCHTPTKVLVTAQDRENYLTDYLGLAKTLRDAGINTEVFLDHLPLRDQMAYASKKGIPIAIIAGGDELSENAVLIKDLNHVTQEKISTGEMVRYIKRKLQSEPAA